MALPVTSGTAAFLVTRDDIITVALENLKVLTAGQSPAAADLTTCGRRLNMILKSFNQLGYLRWCYQVIIIPMVATQKTYTIAESGSPSFTNARPVRVAHAWRRDLSTTPNQDTPLNPLSRQGYDMLTPKDLPGIPNSWLYDPQIGLSSVTLWPVPQDATNSLGLAIQRPIQDITSGTQNFDLEQEWYLPLGWILSDEVALAYQVDGEVRAECTRKAEYWRANAANFSQEDASLTITPDMQGQGQSGRFES